MDKALLEHFKKEYEQIMIEFEDKTNLQLKNIPCPICKAENKESQDFCNNCGVKLKYSFLKYLK